MTETIDQDKKKKTKKVLRIIGDVVFWTIVAVLISIFVCNGIDKITNYGCPIFGFRQSVVASESMSKAYPDNTYLTPDMKRIQKYDIILTKNYKKYEDIQLYDVITYTDGKNLICHRVVELYQDNGKNYIVTRGDANNADDTPIEYSLVRGKVINVTPWFGRVLLFIQSPFILLAVFGSLFFVFLGMFIYDNEKDKRKAKKEGLVVGEAIEKEGLQLEEPPETIEEKGNENGQNG